MIVFDLQCAGGHVFEAWFGSSLAYEDQRERGMIACPLCGNAEVGKAVMAPNVAAKGNSRADASPPAPPPQQQQDAPSPQAVKAAIAALAAAQAELLSKSQWVGASFADIARAMHLGETPQAPIHGQTTPQQAQELIEEGVPVAPLLLPIVPPETRN